MTTEGGERFPRQYRAVAFSGIAILFVALSVLIVWPFMPAILWALVLSILVAPIYEKWRERLGQRKNASTLSALAATLMILLIVCLPFLMVFALLSVQLGAASNTIATTSLNDVPALLQNSVQPILNRLGIDFNLVDYWASHGNEIVQSLRAPLSKIGGQVAMSGFTLVVALLSMFFFLRDGHLAYRPALDLSGIPEDRFKAILHRLSETVRAVFIGTVLVAIIQGLIIGVTYAMIGVPNSVVLGLVSVVLCIVPLLGAPVIYVPIALLLLTQGKTWQAMVLLGVGFLIVSQIDNLLKPFLIGSRVALHPLAIFFFILGGIALVGPIGLMVGPMVLSATLAVQDIVRERLGTLEPTEDASFIGESVNEADNLA